MGVFAWCEAIRCVLGNILIKHCKNNVKIFSFYINIIDNVCVKLLGVLAGAPNSAKFRGGGLQGASQNLTKEGLQ